MIYVRPKSNNVEIIFNFIYRSRQEYEVQSTRLDQELQDNKRYLSTVQVENARLNDQNRQTQVRHSCDVNIETISVNISCFSDEAMKSLCKLHGFISPPCY